jgi:hypothetical protein
VEVANVRRGKNGERSDLTGGERMTWVNKDQCYWCVGVGSQDRYDVCCSDNGTPAVQKGAG